MPTRGSTTPDAILLAVVKALTQPGNTSGLTAATCFISANPEEPPVNPGLFWCAVAMLLDGAGVDDPQITGGGINTLSVETHLLMVLSSVVELDIPGQAVSVLTDATVGLCQLATKVLTDVLQVNNQAAATDGFDPQDDSGNYLLRQPGHIVQSGFHMRDRRLSQLTLAIPITFDWQLG